MIIPVAVGGLSVSVLGIGIGAAFILKRTFDKMNEKSEDEKNCEEVFELPGKVPIFGHFLHLTEKGDFNLNYFKELTSIHRTVRVSLPFAPSIYWTSDPNVIGRILQSGFKENVYEKAEFMINQYKDFLGKGIFLVNGEQWKSKRKMASNLFHHRNLKSYISIFLKNSVKFVNIVNRIRENNEEDYANKGIDFQGYFMRYTLDSFCEIGFGVNINSLNSNEAALRFQEAFDFVQTYADKRARTGELGRYKEFFWKNSEFQSHLKYLNDFVFDIINRRKSETEEELEGRGDLLSQLLLHNIKAKKEENKEELISDEELRDWIMNFLIAGRDTTAILMTWCTYLLSLPENYKFYENVVSEIDDLYSISSTDQSNFTNNFNLIDKITFETQKKQKNLRKVLQETLRLYPPVPVDGYAAIKDDIIETSTGSKIFVKKGTFVLYSAWTTHRQEYNFKEAEKFNPDRFDEPITPFSFVPFHGGPRVCLGQEMAFIEAKILITCLLSHFNFHLIGSAQPKQSIILSVRNGLHMHVTPRSENLIARE